MDTHRSYKKEDMLGKDEDKSEEGDVKKEKFIWAYMIRPVHEDERKWRNQIELELTD